MTKNELLESIKENYPKLKSDFYSLLETTIKTFVDRAKFELTYTKPMKETNKPYEIYTARKGRYIVDIKPYRNQFNMAILVKDVKKSIFEVHVSSKGLFLCTRGAYLNKLNRDTFIFESDNGKIDTFSLIQEKLEYKPSWDMRYKLAFAPMILNAIIKNFKTLDFSVNNGLVDIVEYPDANRKLEVTKKEYEDAKPEVVEEEGEGEE